MFTQTLFAQGAGAQGGSPFMSIGMMVAIFAIFYFLLIRPQKQQQKKLAQSLSQLKKGDKIVIAGGILAEYISEKEGGRLAIVRIGEDTKIEIVKSAISSVVTDAMLSQAKVVDKKARKEDKNSIKEELEKASGKDKESKTE